jgi:RNA polymerase sigma factor (sigma-70 family)
MTNAKSQWELLVDNLPLLHAHVRRMVGDRETASEILQEVSLRILVGDAPSDPDRFLAWSWGVVRNVVRLDWRTRKRARTELSLDSSVVDEMHARAPDPEGHIDARASVARIVDRMDDEGLELLIRRYVLEETSTELADDLAQSPAALRMRLMRLRSNARRTRREALTTTDAG